MSDDSKLEGISNYSVWSYKMRNLMSSEEDTLKPSLVEPPPGTTAPTDPAELAALQDQKNKALALIGLSVQDNVIPFILNITDPAECWSVLNTLFAENTTSRKLMLRRRLTNLKFDEGQSMSDFLQKVRQLVNELASVGGEVTDAAIVDHVLLALPDSYEGLVNTLMYSSSVLPSLAELTSILMRDEQLRELRGRRTDGEAPTGPRKKNNSNGRQEQKRTPNRTLQQF